MKYGRSVDTKRKSPKENLASDKDKKNNIYDVFPHLQML